MICSKMLLPVFLTAVSVFVLQGRVVSEETDVHDDLSVMIENIEKLTLSDSMSEEFSCVARAYLSASLSPMDSLHIVVNGYNPILKVMQYNVDNAVRDEAYEETKWANRSIKVAKLINEVAADIVCLQELRRLPGNPTPEQFLVQFDHYRHVLAYRNPSRIAFGQAILYNPEKLFLLQHFSRWLSDTPEEVSDNWNPPSKLARGNIVQCAQFALVHDEKIVQGVTPFWVFNVHFGLDEDIKTRSSHKLLEIVAKTAGNQPYIVCGDFNFFPDKGGVQQRAILTRIMQDLGRDALTLSGKKIEGTFIGYEQDPFKADLSNLQARLDHIFASSSSVKQIGDAILYTKTMTGVEPEEFSTRNYPSDHLPLVVKLKVFNDKDWHCDMPVELSKD